MAAAGTIAFDRLVVEDAVHVGGKCASLGTMSQAGLPVPPGFAVTTSVFVEARERSAAHASINGLFVDVDVNDSAELSRVAQIARDRVRSWVIPDEYEGQIRRLYADLCALCAIADVPVAVRSSATCEDSPDASFAGEHDTFLWVCGIDAVLDRIRACWASLFTDRAIAYRTEMGYDHDQVEMAVAVQKMVRPRAAGVAFTLDPSNGDRSGICIDAAWGFGEGVVSGDVTPDNYLVDKVMWSITRRVISPKTHAHLLVGGSDGPATVQRVELDPDRVNAPALTDEEIVAVARLARQAERHYGRPQDVEWAVDEDLPADEAIVLLQARPETVWSRKSTHVESNRDLMQSIVETLVNPLYAKK